VLWRGFFPVSDLAQHYTEVRSPNQTQIFFSHLGFYIADFCVEFFFVAQNDNLSVLKENA